MDSINQQSVYSQYSFLNSFLNSYSFLATLTHGGIPYAVAYCQACFALQDNGVCWHSKHRYLWSLLLTLCLQNIKHISAALQIKTSLTIGSGIGFPPSVDTISANLS